MTTQFEREALRRMGAQVEAEHQAALRATVQREVEQQGNLQRQLFHDESEARERLKLIRPLYEQRVALLRDELAPLLARLNALDKEIRSGDMAERERLQPIYSHTMPATQEGTRFEQLRVSAGLPARHEDPHSGRPMTTSDWR